MYRFPVTEDLAFLKANEVCSITLQPYAVDIKFSEGTLIRIERGFEYVDTEGRRQLHDPQCPLETGPIVFHAIVGDRIEHLASEDYRLTLVFESGRRLVILSDDSQYEAGQIMPAWYVDGVLQGSPMIIF